MSCQAQMVRGLGRRSPWAGLDDESLNSCFGHAAAVIVRVAVSGQRADWRTSKDLEKAQVAAFRHQALEHWKRVNAVSRQGERFTVAFDADRHAPDHAPIDRLFEQPDLHTIERDLLAELVDDRLRAFWTLVLREHLAFKDAGHRLGLTRAGVMACTRQGRTAFADYLVRRESGALCTARSRDIAARESGTADAAGVERAAAHLEACYACALVHEPETSALQRGILGLAPTGLVLRILSRAGDAASTPVARIVDSGSGSRAVAAGLAAVAVGAGSGVDISSERDRKTDNGAPVDRPAIAPPASTRSTALESLARAGRAKRGRTADSGAAARPSRRPRRLRRLYPSPPIA
jgi:hypothetical protein